MNKNRLFYLVIGIGAGLVLYLSWRSEPQMAAVWFVPRWLAVWADQNRNDTVRTAVPLLVLGSVVGGRLAWQNRPLQQWLLAWAILTGPTILAEAGQLLLAHRSFDLGDISWGAVGALSGLATAAAVRGVVGATRLTQKLMR